MSDAPMTPSDFAKGLHHKMAAAQNQPYEDGDTCEDCDEEAAEQFAAIRREAQAEALEQAAESIDRRAAQWQNVDIKAELVNEAMTVRALSPIPNYRERIVAQAKLEEAKLWNSIRLTAVNLPGQAQLEAAARLADLARLAAADAEKPAEGA